MDEIKSESTKNNDLLASSDEWESDEENEQCLGYKPLPQDPVENGETCVNTSSNNVNPTEVTPMNAAAVPPQKHVSHSTSAPNSAMDQGHANVIVKAMVGFSLSPGSIPEWAKLIPEEVWKNELLTGLKHNKSSSNSR